MLKGWFGRKNAIQIKDDDEPEEDRPAGLGGFGSVGAFDTEPIRDPRVQEEEAAPAAAAPTKSLFSSFAFSASTNEKATAEEEKALAKKPASRKKVPRGHDNHDDDSSNNSYGSSSSSSEDSDAEKEDFLDDHSVDESTIAGPLFDESAYAVNDDTSVADSYVSGQEGTWRQQKANDFLSDFYADREEKKKKKKEKKEEIIASKNKGLASSSETTSLPPTGDDGFPAFPAPLEELSRPAPGRKEERQPEKTQSDAVPKRRLSTGAAPRRLSAGGAPKFASIPEDGEADDGFGTTFSSDNTDAKNAFEGAFGASNFDDVAPENEPHHKAMEDDSIQEDDGFTEYGENNPLDDSVAAVYHGEEEGDGASVSTDGRSRRTNKSSASHSTFSSRRASVESAATFADYEPRTASSIGPHEEDETEGDDEEDAAEGDDGSREHERESSDEEDGYGSESNQEVVSDEEKHEDEAEEEDETENESSLQVDGNKCDELDDSSAGFDESAFSGNFENTGRGLEADESVESEPESPTKEGNRLHEDINSLAESPKTRKEHFSEDSDVSDPDEPEPVSNSPKLFGYLESSPQQTAFEDDEGSFDSTPSPPTRTSSGGQQLLGGNSEHSDPSDDEINHDRNVRSESKRSMKGNDEEISDLTPSRPSRKASVDPQHIVTGIVNSSSDGDSESHSGAESVSIAEDEAQETSESHELKDCKSVEEIDVSEILQDESDRDQSNEQLAQDDMHQDDSESCGHDATGNNNGNPVEMKDQSISKVAENMSLESEDESSSGNRDPVKVDDVDSSEEQSESMTPCNHSETNRQTEETAWEETNGNDIGRGDDDFLILGKVSASRDIDEGDGVGVVEPDHSDASSASSLVTPDPGALCERDHLNSSSSSVSPAVTPEAGESRHGDDDESSFFPPASSVGAGEDDDDSIDSAVDHENEARALDSSESHNEDGSFDSTTAHGDEAADPSDASEVPSDAELFAEGSSVDDGSVSNSSTNGGFEAPQGTLDNSRSGDISQAEEAEGSPEEEPVFDTELLPEERFSVETTTEKPDNETPTTPSFDSNSISCKPVRKDPYLRDNLIDFPDTESEQLWEETSQNAASTSNADEGPDDGPLARVQMGQDYQIACLDPETDKVVGESLNLNPKPDRVSEDPRAAAAGPLDSGSDLESESESSEIAEQSPLVGDETTKESQPTSVVYTPTSDPESESQVDDNLSSNEPKPHPMSEKLVQEDPRALASVVLVVGSDSESKWSETPTDGTATGEQTTTHIQRVPVLDSHDVSEPELLSESGEEDPTAGEETTQAFEPESNLIIEKSDNEDQVAESPTTEAAGVYEESKESDSDDRSASGTMEPDSTLSLQESDNEDQLAEISANEAVGTHNESKEPDSKDESASGTQLLGSGPKPNGLLLGNESTVQVDSELHGSSTALFIVEVRERGSPSESASDGSIPEEHLSRESRTDGSGHSEVDAPNSEHSSSTNPAAKNDKSYSEGNAILEYDPLSRVTLDVCDVDECHGGGSDDEPTGSVHDGCEKEEQVIPTIQSSLIHFGDINAPDTIPTLQSSIMYFGGDVCDSDVVPSMTTSLSHMGDIDVVDFDVMDDDLAEGVESSPPPLVENEPEFSSNTLENSTIAEERSESSEEKDDPDYTVTTVHATQVEDTMVAEASENDDQDCAKNMNESPPSSQLTLPQDHPSETNLQNDLLQVGDKQEGEVAEAEKVEKLFEENDTPHGSDRGAETDRTEDNEANSKQSTENNGDPSDAVLPIEANDPALTRNDNEDGSDQGAVNSDEVIDDEIRSIPEENESVTEQSGTEHSLFVGTQEDVSAHDGTKNSDDRGDLHTVDVGEAEGTTYSNDKEDSVNFDAREMVTEVDHEGSRSVEQADLSQAGSVSEKLSVDSGVPDRTVALNKNDPSDGSGIDDEQRVPADTNEIQSNENDLSDASDTAEDVALSSAGDLEENNQTEYNDNLGDAEVQVDYSVVSSVAEEGAYSADENDFSGDEKQHHLSDTNTVVVNETNQTDQENHLLSAGPMGDQSNHSSVAEEAVYSEYDGDLGSEDDDVSIRSGAINESSQSEDEDNLFGAEASDNRSEAIDNAEEAAAVAEEDGDHSVDSEADFTPENSRTENDDQLECASAAQEAMDTEKEESVGAEQEKDAFFDSEADFTSHRENPQSEKDSLWDTEAKEDSSESSSVAEEAAYSEMKVSIGAQEDGDGSFNSGADFAPFADTKQAEEDENLWGLEENDDPSGTSNVAEEADPSLDSGADFFVGFALKDQTDEEDNLQDTEEQNVASSGSSVAEEAAYSHDDSMVAQENIREDFGSDQENSQAEEDNLWDAGESDDSSVAEDLAYTQNDESRGVQQDNTKEDFGSDQENSQAGEDNLWDTREDPSGGSSLAEDEAYSQDPSGGSSVAEDAAYTQNDDSMGAQQENTEGDLGSDPENTQVEEENNLWGTGEKGDISGVSSAAEEAVFLNNNSLSGAEDDDISQPGEVEDGYGSSENSEEEPEEPGNSAIEPQPQPSEDTPENLEEEPEQASQSREMETNDAVVVDEEEDEEVRIAKEMALALTKNPGLTPDQLRAMVASKDSKEEVKEKNPKSSWGLSLFSGKRSELQEDPESEKRTSVANTVAQDTQKEEAEKQVEEEKPAVVKSSWSLFSSKRSESTASSVADDKKAADECTERTVEELKSVVVEERKTDPGDAKPKSSWGLFSSKKSESTSESPTKETNVGSEDAKSSDGKDANKTPEEKPMAEATKDKEPKPEDPKPKSSWGLFSSKKSESMSELPPKETNEAKEKLVENGGVKEDKVEEEKEPESDDSKPKSSWSLFSSKKSDSMSESATQETDTAEEKPVEEATEDKGPKPEDTKPKSSWSLFSSKKSDSMSEPATAETDMAAENDETSSSNGKSSDENDKTEEEKSVDEAKSSVVKDTKPETDAPKPKSSWGISLFSSKAKSEDQDETPNEDEVAKSDEEEEEGNKHEMSSNDAGHSSDTEEQDFAASQDDGDSTTRNENNGVAATDSEDTASSAGDEGKEDVVAGIAPLDVADHSKTAENSYSSGEQCEEEADEPLFDEVKSVGSEEPGPTEELDNEPWNTTTAAVLSAEADEPKAGEEELFGYGTDESESDNGDVGSVSSDFRDNELSKAMKLLNGDFDDESVLTEMEYKSPALPFTMADDASDEEGGEPVTADEDEDPSSSSEIVKAEKNLVDDPIKAKSAPDAGDDNLEGTADTTFDDKGADESEKEDSEEDSDDEDSDSDEEGEDSEEEEQPHQVIVKEAPLLRLENVTAQTRSMVPEKGSQKKGGWSSWLFGAEKEKKEAEEKAEKEKEEKEKAEKEKEEKEKEDETVEHVTDNGASVAAGEGAESPETDVAASPDKIPGEEKVEVKPEEKKKSKKEKKKAKKEKKEKGGLSSHFSKRQVRTFTRHGDEMSVGTMNLKAAQPKEEQQHVVIAHNTRVFDDNLDFSKEDRPWDKDAPNRSSAKAKLKQSELNADIAIDEGSEGSEGSDDSPDVGPTLDSLFGGDFDKQDGLEGLDGLDALSQADGISQAETTSLSILESALQKDKPAEVDFDDMWDTMSADVSTAMEYEKKQRENFRKKKEKKKSSARGGDDDDDDDEVKRLRLFEKHSEKDSKSKKGKKGKKSKKKESLSMEFLAAIREVFDEDEEGGSDDDDASSDESRGGRSHGSRMRNDDDYDDDKSEISMFIGAQQYMGNKRRGDGDADDLGSAGSDEEPSVAESDDGSYVDGRGSIDDDVSEAKSRRSHRSKTTRKTERSRRTSRTSRTSSSRSTRIKKKPAQVLQEELDRQQGGKLLSVSSLRQEMSDRRGTSVELLKKEFERQKREKAAKVERQQAPEESLIGKDLKGGFGGFGSRSGGFGSTSDPFISGAAFEASFSDLNATKSTNTDTTGLGGHLSRWEDKEMVSDLDDLQTVQAGDNPSGPSDGFDTFGPPAGIIDTLGPAIPSMPTDLLGGPSASKPKKKSSKKKLNGGFDATFDDMPMPMTTIAEFDDDDDNEMGLLASSNHGGGGDDDDMSYRSSRSTRSNRASGRFGLGLKAPKLKIGKFMPKKKKKEESVGQGFFDGDNDSNGLLG